MKPTHIIAITNHKGGVGKTTTSVSLAAGLNQRGKKVLLIDLDAQANATISLGVIPEEQEKSIYGALRGQYPLPITEIVEGFDLVASILDLGAAETELINEFARERILAELITPIRDKYDYILIDCPPGLGLLTSNALTAATGVIIPVEPEPLAVRGLSKLQGILDMVTLKLNKDLVITGVLMTKYNSQTILNKSAREIVASNFPNKIFKTVIRKNIAFGEATASGKSIFESAPNSHGAEDYMELCKEILTLHK